MLQMMFTDPTWFYLYVQVLQTQLPKVYQWTELNPLIPPAYNDFKKKKKKQKASWKLFAKYPSTIYTYIHLCVFV